MAVTQLARTDPVAATRGTPITRVASLMREENVGSVVVVEENHPVGVVTDRDVATEVTALGHDPTAVTAEEVMSAHPVTVERDTGLMELTQVMAESGVRRIPVVDEEGRLDGIVTLDDVNRLLSDEQQHLAAVIEAESPPY